MTKRFLAVMALMMAALLGSSIVAQAADVKFGGIFRPRYEIWEQRSFNENRNAHSFVNMRMRLNANVTIDENTSGFFQFQTNSRWGFTHTPSSPNSGTTDVGLHQVYVVVKNLFGTGIEGKIGRQEIVLDGHRLFGNTIWTQGGQSHDAARFNYYFGEHTLSFFISKVVEQASTGPGGTNGTSNDDNQDVTEHVLWANFKNLVGAGSSLSLYGVFSDQNSGAQDADFYTVGARLAGSMVVDYRFEGYYQGGNAGTGLGNHRRAFMFGARVGKTLKDVAMKPGITLWYDYLSGTSASQAAGGDVGAFNVLYDTGHKFYGLIDIWLAPSNTNNQGLIDYAVKLKANPMANTTLKVDLHYMQLAAPRGGPQSIGEEIDVTLAHKCSNSTKIVLGYSHFFALDNFFDVSPHDIGTGRNDPTNQDADWFYAMLVVKF